jgi:putative glutamine amidotransferase
MEGKLTYRTMKRPPIILITANTQNQGSEFGDHSLSLSEAYVEAVRAAGGVPLALPNLTGEQEIAELVRLADGILLSGGDDVGTRLYAERLPKAVAATVVPGPPARDLMELMLIREVFTQRKPLLALCRGHQIFNVAMGGDMITDLSHQVPRAMDHRRSDCKDAVVHRVKLEPGSFLARLLAQDWIDTNSSHHQAVGQVAGILQVAGRTSDGVIEALELKPEHGARLPYLVSVQFHPERLFAKHPEHLAIFLSFVAACRK